jgi:hypothetical protein
MVACSVCPVLLLFDFVLLEQNAACGMMPSGQYAAEQSVLHKIGLVVLRLWLHHAADFRNWTCAGRW